MKTMFLYLSCLWAGILTSAFYSSCGSPKPQETIVIEDKDPDIVKCADGTQLGGTKFLTCPVGQTGKILQVCSFNGGKGEWKEIDNSCTQTRNTCQQSAENKVTFNKDIKKEIEQYCLKCHNTPERYSDYAVAKRLMEAPRYELLNSITRDDSGRMPKGGDSLPPKVIDKFKQWLIDGLLEGEECADRDTQGNEYLHNSLEYIEDKILNDLKLFQDDKDRANARYLVLGNKYNERQKAESYALFIKAIGKSANSLSLEENITLPTAIDARETIYRINLEDFNLDEDTRFGSYDGYGRTVSNGWDLILNADPFKFESFTVAGEVIKGLAQTDFPWLHADNFAFISHINADVYYTALNIPNNVNQLFLDLGVDWQEVLDDEEVICAGGNGSEISQNKNRLLCRVECERSELCSDKGYVWITFDPVALDGVPERDLFSNPLIADFGLNSNFEFAASEWIWVLPNGMQAYFLANAAGVRQDFAPLDIVSDTSEGGKFDPTIRNSLSCHRCHAQGINPFSDQILGHVTRNASEFDQDVRDKVFAIFPEPRSLSAQYQLDNKNYAKALDRFKIELKDPDPINYLTDQHREDWNIKKFCAFILLEINDCTKRINQSDIVIQAVGGLLSEGGTVTRDQVIDNFKDIKLGLRLGQEVIGQ